MLEELNDNLQQADGQEQTASIENESTSSVTTELESDVLEVTDTETVSQILEEEISVSAQDEIDNHLAEASQDGSFQDDLEIEIKDYGLKYNDGKLYIPKLESNDYINLFITVQCNKAGKSSFKVNLESDTPNPYLCTY